MHNGVVVGLEILTRICATHTYMHMYLSHCKYKCIFLLSRFQRLCNLRWHILKRRLCFFPRSLCNRQPKKHCRPNAYWISLLVRQSCGICGAVLLLFGTKLAYFCDFDRVGLSLLTACLKQHISCGVRSLVKGISCLLDWCGRSSKLASSSQFRKGDTLHHACRGLSETFTNPILQRQSRHGQTLHAFHSSACQPLFLTALQ